MALALRFGSPEFEAVKIGLASTEQILMWSHGEVEKPETINYRTFKPERKGLFCEKIFGPVKDWECHCGKYRRVRYRGIVCERCGVEVTTSRVRRDRMGHIRLSVPVSHVWFLKGVPGYMGLLLDMTTRSLEKVIYYDAYVITEVSGVCKGKLEVGEVLREGEYQEYKEKFGNSFKAEMGAKPIRELLSRIDIPSLVKELRKELKGSVGQRRMKVIKRLRVAEAFLNSGNLPDWMVMEVMPVLPPDLRPMVQLEGGRFAASDLNDLYRRVLNRNNRLKKMISMGAPDMIIRNEKRMLQEAVDVLIDNGRRKRPVTGPNGRPLKSLSSVIEGKQGRFRQNLLGKRADYSGRSVIVVGPHLKLHQCGLPKEMALELFKPFVIRKLVEKGFSQNVKSAKRQIEHWEVVVWDILEEVIQGHAVLLNRAPTLHRLGVQAFEPILVEGKAIQIHPLVCTAFNADFDGDQMAVHVPLLTEAQTEARIIMLSANNLLSPASGRPIVTPTQDMVLGTYYMTAEDTTIPLCETVFANVWDAMIAHDLGKIELQGKIKIRVDGKFIETTAGRVKFSYTIQRVLEKHSGIIIPFINRVFDKRSLERFILDCYKKYGMAVTAEVADEIKRLGFKYSTLAGISISIADLKVPPSKKKLVERATFQSDQLEKSFRAGTLSAKEKFMRTLDIWSAVTEDVTNDMKRGYEKDDPLNSVYMMANSGARGSMQQVRQLAAIRGLMADPSGNIISIPIKANFKEGLNVTEYFISSYGARKGLVDTALRTADSGYLTRRLVDVAQDVIISEEVCESIEGVALAAVKEGYDEVMPLEQRLIGRTALASVSDSVTGNKIVKAGEEIDEKKARQITDAGIDRVEVYSVMTCRAKKGICRRCYGRDLSSGNLINIGEAIGIIAAQSIGEPGTQLTMRTFHIGGVAVHKPTTVVVKAKHVGKVSFAPELETKPSYDDAGEEVKVVTREAVIYVEVKDKKEEHTIPVGAYLKVKNGDMVKTGDTLVEYDPSYEYLITSTAGRVKYIDFTIQERKQKFHSGLSITERMAQKDGEIFIYSPKVKTHFDVPAEGKALVRAGERVMIGTELSPGVISSVAGVVLEAKDGGSRKGEVVVAPGETYSIPSGSRVYVDEGAEVAAYAILGKVEAIRRDPSKTKDIIQGLPKVEELFEARRPKDAAVLSEIEGTVDISEREGRRYITVQGAKDAREYEVNYDSRILVAKGDKAAVGVPLSAGSLISHDVLRIMGVKAVQTFLVEEIQKIYRGQGVTINDKHIETIVRQMTRKVRVLLPGDTMLLPGELVDVKEFAHINSEIKTVKAEGVRVLLGITKASLSTDSFISAASFQETSRILADAAIKGKIDVMSGLKENVIIGKLIPAGTGFTGYHNLELVPYTGKKKKL